MRKACAGDCFIGEYQSKWLEILIYCIFILFSLTAVVDIDNTLAISENQYRDHVHYIAVSLVL